MFWPRLPPGCSGRHCFVLRKTTLQTPDRGGAGLPAMCAAQTAANFMRNEGRSDCPGEAGPGDWPHGWQFHASRVQTNCFRGVLLPISKSCQRAAAWLTAVPADNATTLPPEVMQIALRRRLRLRLPLGPATCGQKGHSCGRRLDVCAHQLNGKEGKIGRTNVDCSVPRDRGVGGARRLLTVVNAHFRPGRSGSRPQRCIQRRGKRLGPCGSASART